MKKFNSILEKVELYGIELNLLVLFNVFKVLVAGVGFEPTTFRLCPEVNEINTLEVGESYYAHN